MRKTFLLILMICGCSCFYGRSACAQDQAPLNALTGDMIAADTAQSPDGSLTAGLNKEDIEKSLKAREVLLRKIKEEHFRNERKQHLQETELVYQQAVRLYRQQRWDLARDEFEKAQEMIADYRSTRSFLRAIDKQSAQGLNENSDIPASKQRDIEQELDRVEQEIGSR